MEIRPRVFLFIAHPGHELRVYRWLELNRPLCWILTDGSGSNRASRIDFSKKILLDSKARLGSIMGDWKDVEIYQFFLEQNFEFFSKLFHSLVDTLLSEKINFVVGDALEGYNPSHDLVRYLLNAAVFTVQKRIDYTIQNYDFSLVDHPLFCPVHLIPDAIKIQLDAQSVQRKINVCQNYEALSEEVNKTFNSKDPESFAIEYLRRCDPLHGIENLSDYPPFYEKYGEQQVQKGIYQKIIRYHQHVQPMIKKLWAMQGLFRCQVSSPGYLSISKISQTLVD